MYKQKLKNSTQQKAGTRTLIQAGTLLKLAGFFERCHIEDGDDLQDFGAQDRAATLLGALMEAFEKMPHEPTDKQLAQWKTKGAAVMKMQKAKVLKHKAPV